MPYDEGQLVIRPHVQGALGEDDVPGQAEGLQRLPSGDVELRMVQLHLQVALHQPVGYPGHPVVLIARLLHHLLFVQEDLHRELGQLLLVADAVLINHLLVVLHKVTQHEEESL